MVKHLAVTQFTQMNFHASLLLHADVSNISHIATHTQSRSSKFRHPNEGLPIAHHNHHHHRRTVWIFHAIHHHFISYEIIILVCVWYHFAAGYLQISRWQNVKHFFIFIPYKSCPTLKRKELIRLCWMKVLKNGTHILLALTLKMRIAKFRMQTQWWKISIFLSQKVSWVSKAKLKNDE